MNCSYCNAEHTVKNGSNSVRTAKRLCRNCKRQFVENPKNKPISKETGLTNHIERFNNTLRQRVSRLNG